MFSFFVNLPIFHVRVKGVDTHITEVKRKNWERTTPAFPCWQSTTNERKSKCNTLLWWINFSRPYLLGTPPTYPFRGNWENDEPTPTLETQIERYSR